MSEDLERRLEEVRANALRANSPQSRNGFRLGDPVRLPCLDVTFEIVGLSDPSLVDLLSPSGRIIRAGWRVISKLKTHHAASTEE